MIYLTRRERFSAAHRLYNPALSDMENEKKYGLCANPNWHGHNYILWLTVKGYINEKNGYVVNLKDLSKILKERVISQLDHKNINLEVPFMKDVIVSTENLAIAIWKEIEQDIRNLGVEIHCIKIQETENNTVEYYGDENQ